MYGFSRKMFLMLHSINWPNFIIWLLLLSWERKELLRWNKKYFSSFLKGFHLSKIVSDLREGLVPISIYLQKLISPFLTSDLVFNVFKTSGKTRNCTSRKPKNVYRAWEFFKLSLRIFLIVSSLQINIFIKKNDILNVTYNYTIHRLEAKEETKL